MWLRVDSLLRNTPRKPSVEASLGLGAPEMPPLAVSFMNIQSLWLVCRVGPDRIFAKTGFYKNTCLPRFLF